MGVREALLHFQALLLQGARYFIAREELSSSSELSETCRELSKACQELSKACQELPRSVSRAVQTHVKDFSSSILYCKQKKTCCTSAASTGPRMVLASCDVCLGQSLDTDDILLGHVYDFRLWSRALTVSEVAAGCKV